MQYLNAQEFQKAAQQTVEYIAAHPPFEGPSLPLGLQWAGDPQFIPQLLSPICPHCGKCRFCGR
jgi:hypothetical protein